jgi:hypothetical protein
MTSREKIIDAGKQYGWERTEEPNRYVWVRPGPMIQRKLEDRVVVYFDGSRIAGAYWGSDSDHRQFVTGRRNLPTVIVEHLLKIGTEKRAR